MKKNCPVLRKKLRWKLDRHGANHDVWTNGIIFESVPRHNEVKEMLAKKILKRAREYPGNIEE